MRSDAEGTSDERLETFDDSGRPTGLVPRSRVHRDGLWHCAVNVFLLRTDGRLLIQRRQHSKDVWPGAWDLSVAEHLQAGEGYADAAVRGMREELGISEVELERLGGVARSRVEDSAAGVRDYELQRSFRGVFDGTPAPDSREVSEVRLVSVEELRVSFQRHPELFTPWFRTHLTGLKLGIACARSVEGR